MATIDDRHVGRAADERQLIWTAVALIETGQVAQARGRDFNYITGNGEAVSRFGMGMSLAQLPAAWCAPHIERLLRPGSSQPIFLLAPLAFVLLTAGWAGRIARLLGGEQRGAWMATILCGLGSPLGSYAATSFSEPLQAAALAGAYACALAASAARSGTEDARWTLAAGVAVSVSVLTKSSMVVIAPATLLPLLLPSAHLGRHRRLFLASLGALPLMLVWGYWEVVRFGALFGGYPGEGFTHPFLDGIWRLLVGPNAGFLLFFPAAAVAARHMGQALRSGDPKRAALVAGGLLPALGLLALAAPWWAWHGVWGWGPRLLVPAIGPLAGIAAAHLTSRHRGLAAAFVAASIVVNLPGLLQHPVPVQAYETNLTWPPAPTTVARSMAGYAWRVDETGTTRVSPDHVLSKVPAATPWIVFPWFFGAATQDDPWQSASMLERPPWRRSRPDLLPPIRPVTAAWARGITGYPRARFLGRGLRPSIDDASYAAVYLEGLADQVVRLQQRHDGTAALELAQKLVGLAPFGRHDALVLECFRIRGGHTDRITSRRQAADYLSSLSTERRLFPTLNVVLALFERDAGNRQGAVNLLGSVAGRFPPDAPLHRALTSELDQWPDDLQSMIANPVEAAGE